MEKERTLQGLAVPIGLRGQDDLVSHLHEKAHGPHGLIAGRLDQEVETIHPISYPSVNFHPHDVAFFAD